MPTGTLSLRSESAPFRRLTPLDEKNVRPHDRVAVVDIETAGLDARASAFRLGVVRDEEGYYRFTDRLALQAHLTDRRYRGYTIWAHNGGGFDYLCIFGNLFRFFGPQDVFFREGRFISATYHDTGKNTVRFMDSMNLYPGSIAKLGDAMGLPKGETPAKFIHGLCKPGVCVATGGKGAKSACTGGVIELEEMDFVYTERDCEIAYVAVRRMFELYGDLRPTVSSMAMSVYRRRFLRQSFPDGIPIRSDLDYRFRDAYYGGRVEAYKLGATPRPNYLWDVNSLFPQAQWLGPYPDTGTLVERRGSPERLAEWLEAYEGFAVCKVVHKEHRVGHLPYRREDGRLLFPVGRFSGAWCFPELRYALKQGVIKVTEVEFAVTGDRLQSPFKAYVEHFYALKRNETGIMREQAKIFLNGLYGKLGENIDRGERYGQDFDPEVFEFLRLKHPDVQWVPFTYKGERTDGYYIWAETEPSRSAVYAWAAYVTAIARVINLQWQKRFVDMGANVIYTDTDSWLVTDRQPPAEWVGDGLGLLKLVEGKEIGEIHGNKDYVLSDGSLVIKGVSRNAVQLNDSTFTYPSIRRLRSALRMGVEPGTPYVIAKELKRKYDKRELMKDGTTRPIAITE